MRRHQPQLPQRPLLLLAAVLAAGLAAAVDVGADAAPQPDAPAPAEAGGAVRVASVQRSSRAMDCSSLGSGCQQCRYGITHGRGLLHDGAASDSGWRAADGSEQDAAADRALLQSSGDFSFGAGGRNSGGAGGRGTSRGQAGASTPGGGGASSGGASSGGGRGMTCTACNTNRNYRLRTLPDGTRRCDCQAGYGAYLRGPAAQASSYGAYWESQHLDSFSCHTCPAGQVPFLPGSNLQLVWDGADWWIELIDATPGGGGGGSAWAGVAALRNGGRARGRPRLASKAAAAAIPPPPESAAAAAARPAALRPAQLQQEEQQQQQQPDDGAEQQAQQGGADFGAESVGAGAAVVPAHASSWYHRGTRGYPYPHHYQHQYPQYDNNYVSPPLYPGQCVTCPDGSYQDGDQCVASGPSPPSPSPGPRPSPTPSPRPSPRPSPSPGPPPSPRPSPSPGPKPSPSPSPSTYCCGTSTCATPVPVPPQDEVLSLARARPTPTIRASGALRRHATHPLDLRVPANAVSAAPRLFPPAGGADGADVRPQTMCSVHPRTAVGSPPWTGINAAMATLTTIFADTDTNTTCAYTADNPVTYLCTAQQLAPYLLLSSAHCMDAYFLQQEPGCANLRLVAIYICYDYNPQAGSTVDWVCPNDQIVEATGASWNRNRGDPGRVDNPYDQAIVFTAQPRPGPFFQYNYMENIDTTSSFNSWLTRGFSWTGVTGNTDPTLNRCGCKVCTNMTCNLAVSGPQVGAITQDPDAPVANTAYNPNLETCAGSGGACLSVGTAGCCVGIQSYERIPEDTPSTCSSLCSNYWSAISTARPLSALWRQIQAPLPDW